jgi:hypothetical protein
MFAGVLTGDARIRIAAVEVKERSRCRLKSVREISSSEYFQPISGDYAED